MNAAPILSQIAELLARHGLEVVMIGNAAAALQGAPVTTIDIDFLFRKTPANLKRLKAIAAELEAVILAPYYPVSGLLRVSRDTDGLQLDFMSVVDGVRSFEGLRKRAMPVSFGGARIYDHVRAARHRRRASLLGERSISCVERAGKGQSRSGSARHQHPGRAACFRSR